MRPVVLVTAIGTVTASNIVDELKKTGGYHIIGADINNKNEIATSLFVDEYYKFPLAADDSYIPFILDFCKEHKVEYYFAVIDKEVVKISEHRDKFSEIGTKLCVANYEFIRICHFKDRFSKWIENNIPEIHIRTYDTVNEVKNAAYPLFIKPIEGVASTGCRRIENYRELCSAVSDEKEVVIQEFIDGQIITVDCIRNKKTGQKAQVQRRELLRNANGCGIAVEIISDPVLESICDRLIEELDLNGAANIEFFDTAAGYRIIEINPRLSAGAAFSCMAGVNVIRNAMAIADECECEIGKTEIGAHFAKRYETYRMD